MDPPFRSLPSLLACQRSVWVCEARNRITAWRPFSLSFMLSSAAMLRFPFLVSGILLQRLLASMNITACLFSLTFLRRSSFYFSRYMLPRPVALSAHRWLSLPVLRRFATSRSSALFSCTSGLRQGTAVAREINQRTTCSPSLSPAPLPRPRMIRIHTHFFSVVPNCFEVHPTGTTAGPLGL